jgi:cobalt-zinc-cadmium efflux system protein
MRQPHEHPTDEAQRLLKIGIILSLGIFVLELSGGLWTHSLALVSDAWHIFIDIWSLIISFLAVFLAQRPANDRRTYGLHRMEVMAATVNGLTVSLIAVGILYAAWKRFNHPVPVDVRHLFWISLAGLLLNLIVARLFYKESHRDLNMRGAFLHTLGDALNTFAVMGAAVAMGLTKISRIDAIVSALLAGVVLVGSGRLLKDSFNTLLEGVPPDITVGDVESDILKISGIVSVHDLHVWSICSHLNSLSGHILLGSDRMASQREVLESIGKLLKERFNIVHTTIQVESNSWPNMEGEIGQVQHG